MQQEQYRLQSKLENGIDYPSEEALHQPFCFGNESFDELKKHILEMKEKIECKYGHNQIRARNFKLNVQFTRNNENDDISIKTPSPPPSHTATPQVQPPRDWMPPTIAELKNEKYRLQSKLHNGIDYPTSESLCPTLFPNNESFDELKNDILQMKEEIEGKYGRRRTQDFNLNVQFTRNNGNDDISMKTPSAPSNLQNESNESSNTPLNVNKQSEWTPPSLGELKKERHRLEMIKSFSMDCPLDDLQSICSSVSERDTREQLTNDILRLKQDIDMDYRELRSVKLNVQLEPKIDMIVTFGDNSDDTIYDENVNPCAEVPDYFGDDYKYHTNVFESSDGVYEGPAHYASPSRDQLVDAYQLLLAKFYYGPSHKDPCNPPYEIPDDLTIEDMIDKIIMMQMKIYDRHGVRVSHHLSRLDCDSDSKYIQI